MTAYVCLFADTLSIHHFQDFREDEVTPHDLPHKNLLWRRVVEVHSPFDPGAQKEQGTSVEATDSEYIITHLVVPRPEEDFTPTLSHSLRDVQTEFFASEKLPLTMMVFDLYNEILNLKRLPAASLDDFKKVLQNYA
jgi:hypothetical protein